MAHKQPDFRQNPGSPNRGTPADNPRTDEVIGRFQSTSTQQPSGKEDPRRSSGPGRFFRAASERLRERFGGDRPDSRDSEQWGSASQGYRAEGPSEPYLRGMREGSYRDDSRSFDDQPQRYGRRDPGAGFDVDVDPSFERSAERRYGRGFGHDASRGFERSVDETRTRHRQTPQDEARDIQRRGYPQASYVGGGELREDRGQYSDFGRREPSYTGESRRGRWQREPLTAQEIMTRNPRTVHRESPLRDAAQIMKDENVGIVPVVDEGNRLVGVLTDRDLVVRAFVDEKDPSSLRVSQVMTDDVEAVTPEERIQELIELMGRKQIRRVPVVDRDDRLLGIIAMADIANRAEQDDELQAALERISARRSFWNRL